MMQIIIYLSLSLYIYICIHAYIYIYIHTYNDNDNDNNNDNTNKHVNDNKCYYEISYNILLDIISITTIHTHTFVVLFLREGSC